MSLGWHKQRAAESRMFRRPEPAAKPEPTLDELIERAESLLTKPVLSRTTRSAVERSLKKLLERRRVRDLLAQEDT